MSDSDQETEFETGPRFNKAVLGRILAVGVFIALGTFAVIQTMHRGPNPTLAKNKDSKNDLEQDDSKGIAKGLGKDLGKGLGSAADKLGKGISKTARDLKSSAASALKTGTSAFKPETGGGFAVPKIEPAVVKSKVTTSMPRPQGFGPSNKTPIVTPNLPARKPPERFAQGPGTPLIGNQSGFNASNAPKIPSTPLGGNSIAGKLGTAANNLKTQAGSAADELLRKTSEKASATANSIKSGLGSFGPNNSLNSKSPFPKPKSGFEPPKVQPDFGATTNAAKSPLPNLRPNTNFGGSSSQPTTQAKTAGFAPPTTSPPSTQSGFPTNPRTPKSSFNTSSNLKPITSTNGGFGANRQTSGSQSKSDFGGPGFNTNRSTTQSQLGNRNQSTRGFPPSRPAVPTRAVSTNSSNRPSSRLGSGAGIGIGRTNTNGLTKDIPGERQYEGVQAPALTIEKLSPREIQVKQPADFQLVIKNVGRVAAEEVQVFDQVPNGTEFISASPEPTSNAAGRLVWNLGKLRSGQEKRIKIKLKPIRHGEIGSVAHVAFATKASMRTLVTKPVLDIVHQAKQIHLIGDDVVFDITVKNKGDGPATNVLIQEDVPQQLEFQDGSPGIEYEIGTLMPGQSRRVQLALKAAKIGKLRNVMFASADGGLEARHELPMEVVAPNLVAKTNGPTRRFLERNVTHGFSVANNGTAPASNVELIARLPSGLRFISANNQGRYDSNAHSVFWSLAELGRDQKADVELKTSPVEVGSQPIKFETFADLEVSSSAIQPLSVEHLVDVFFDIDDVVDPIEVGADTSYKIRVVNQGTKAATNVQLAVQFPRGLQPTSIDGSLKHQISGQQIRFEPINSMSPGDEINFVIHSKGQSEGDHRVVVNMKTDGRQTPVSKEETTRVYSDR